MCCGCIVLQPLSVQVDAAAEPHIIPAASGTIVELLAVNIVSIGSIHSMCVMEFHT